MKRKPLTKRGSKRLFKATGTTTHKANIRAMQPSRGGIRM